MKDSVSVSIGNGGDLTCQSSSSSSSAGPPVPVQCNGNGSVNGPSTNSPSVSVTTTGSSNKCLGRSSGNISSSITTNSKALPPPPIPILNSNNSSTVLGSVLDSKKPLMTTNGNGNEKDGGGSHGVKVTVTTTSFESSTPSSERVGDNGLHPLILSKCDSGINNNNGGHIIIDPDTSYDSEEDQPVPGLSPKGGVMHCRIVTAFTKAFAKQNVHFEKAIQSLDSLNEQIISFVFSSDTETLAGKNSSSSGFGKDGKNGEAYTEAFKISIALMRRLLLDVQAKFRKMVEENKALAGRLDGDLQSAHRQMALLRAELSDTKQRVSQLSSPPSSPSTPNHHDSPYGNNSTTTTTNNNNCLQQSSVKDSTEGHNKTAGQVNGIQSNNNGLSNHDLEFIDSTSTVDLDSLDGPELRAECDKLLLQNGNLRRELSELRRGSGGGKGSDLTTQELQTELAQAGNILKAMKADRKRLKAEKFELLNQMKQLYATLEDKEKELRDFIRNYEQVQVQNTQTLSAQLNVRDVHVQNLKKSLDEAEREKWNILRHARDEAERGLTLATQLNVREVQVQQMQEELHEAKRQLAQYGIYAEPDRSNATSHYSLVSSLTATYATVDRGSSADSGVRLSSDRDSGAGLPAASNLSDSANEAISLDLCGGDGSGDGDSMSVISTATLPQLWTPRDSPGPLSYSSFTRSMDANALSRSAEQLLAAEAAESNRRKSGRRTADLTGRASAGAKGAWGSISRVFARNKHRRTLDPSSLYDNTGQRSSWSPQSSVPASPSDSLYDKSYGDKLRALEEAATLPMELWRAGMVQAWIEVSLGMPQYGSRCADNIKSGKVLLELSNEELESELGISHPLHRKKLRLAIEEHRNPALVRYPALVELSHIWVSSEWLPDIGLPQYADNFAGCLVDARLLDHLSKKDLEKYLGVTRKFHLAAIAHGVHLLRIVAYDRQSLAERRRQCENDPLVWTNQHFIQWARSIDLNEYADNLKGSGVHGAFSVLEPSFSGDTLASAMGIPPSKQIIRRHLTAELDALLNPARAKITQQYRVTKSRAMTATSTPPGPAGGRVSDPVGLLSDKRPDSRTSTLTNENFRRSSDDSRRRTSLRTYSLLFAQKGSLSRALGLKIKQDLLHRRQEEKEKSEERDREFLSMLGPPPPLPGRLPGKLPSASTSNSSNTNNTNGSLSSQSHSYGHTSGSSSSDQPLLDDFTSSILLHAKLNNSSHYQSPQSSSTTRPALSSSGQSSSGTPGSRQLQDVDRDNNDGSSNGGNNSDKNDRDEGASPNIDSTDKSSSESASATSSTDALKKHRRVKSISEVDHIAVHTPV